MLKRMRAVPAELVAVLTTPYVREFVFYTSHVDQCGEVLVAASTRRAMSRSYSVRTRHPYRYCDFCSTT